MNFLQRVAILLVGVGLAHAAAIAAQDRSTLLSSFQSERDLEAKEQILHRLTQAYPGAGQELLDIACNAEDSDTQWLAIRGLGYLRFNAAVPFLTRSLSSSVPYVRANSARSLGEIRDVAATSFLSRAIEDEQDGGVIEQMSLALKMLHAVESVPVLKGKARHPSAQTRAWVLQAIADLGQRSDVPFLAEYLFDEDMTVTEMAAKGIEHLTGQDFGFPHASGPVGQGHREAIQKAKTWWYLHRDGLEPL
jgi:hypothetical protein